MMDRIDAWVRRFNLHHELVGHVVHVCASLPQTVLMDLMLDESFTIADYEYVPGKATQVHVGTLRRGRTCRSIVLKRSLRVRDAAFARYVIAHELAHAHLRNAGRHDGEDPEHAADALADEWGFPRP